MKDMLLSNYIWFTLKCDQLREKKLKGLGTVEVILITFVLVTLVILFRKSIEVVVRKYLNQIDPNFSRP